jgi:hypothetical protein
VQHLQLNEDGEGAYPPMNSETLAHEASLVIIAGSESTGTALANVLFFLLTHPACMTRLRAELDAAAGLGAAYDVEIESHRIVDLRYLQAVIDEATRLMPAVPNGVQRTLPEDWAPTAVAGQFVSFLIVKYLHTDWTSVLFLLEPPSKYRLGVVRQPVVHLVLYPHAVIQCTATFDTSRPIRTRSGLSAG